MTTAAGPWLRQDQSDVRLPIDGTLPNPLVVVSGTVGAATSRTLTAAGAFAGHDFSPPPPNARYDDPSLLAGEYIVTITSGVGYKQTRRVASNSADEITLEASFGGPVGHLAVGLLPE